MGEMKFVTIRGFSGINNVQNEARLKGPTVYNPSDLAECAAISNADITDTFSLKLRPGWTASYAGTDPHSLWATPDGTKCYFVEGSYLKSLLPTLTSAISIRLLTAPSLPMSYAQVNYLTVCSNGVDLFLIINGVAYDFVYTSKRFKEAVSAGHIVAVFNRRLYVAIDNALYFTDADDIQRFDENDDPFVFNGRIRGVYPLKSGIFVMADRVHWLGGDGPDELQRSEAYDGKLIEGCAAVFDGSLAGKSGKMIAFVTSDAICLGDGSGQVDPVTLNRLKFTQAGQRGAAVVRKRDGCNQFIAWV